MRDIAVWGDFEVDFEHVVGRGGMGMVYRARQRSLGRDVAIKVLDTSRAPDPAFVQGFLQKFRVEIQALARLQDPRIVSIIQAGENDGHIWFAMELIRGRTVEQCLTDEGSFRPADAARIGSEVARALEAAGRRGIIHRDVKPANIFLADDGSVKLGDFGLARGDEFSPTRLTDVNAVACTPAYAAPETAGGRNTDHRSDLYSLGCVLYEMVTERPPFSDDSPVATLFRHSSETPVSPRLLNPAVPESLESVILKCLQKDPKDRYATYSDLVRDLEPRELEAPRHGIWPWAAAAGTALFGVILTAILTNVEPVEKKLLRPSVAAREEAGPLPPPQVKDESPSPVPLEEKAPPPYVPSDEEMETVRRILAIAKGPESKARLEEFARSERLTPWIEGFIDAERERLRSPVSLDHLARLDESERKRRAPGVVDQAIEDSLRAADAGDFVPLLSIDVPRELEEDVRPFLGEQLAMFREEKHAAGLRAAGDLVRLASGRTRASRKAIAEILAEFRAQPDLELVDEVTFGSWAPDTTGEPPQYDHGSRSYVLTAAGSPERVWIKREFQGARKGYQIRFRFGVPGDPVVAVALSPARWLTVSPHVATLFRKDGEAPARSVRKVELKNRIAGGTVAVVPRPGAVLVYLDGDVLWVLGQEDYGLDGGIKVGAGAGTVILESIRVKDRTR